MLTPAWVAAVLEAQLDDGGWALSPSERGALAETHWHPTALALWALSLYSGQAGDETWVRS